MGKYIEKKKTLARKKLKDGIWMIAISTLLMCGAFGGLGGYLIYVYTDFARGDKYQARVVGLTTNGVHYRYMKDIQYHEVCEFQYNGKLIQVLNFAPARSHNCHDVGEQVTVYYSPGAKWVASTDTSYQLTMGWILVGVASLLFYILSSWMIRDIRKLYHKQKP